MAKNLHVIPKKMSNTKLKLSDLNPHLMCVLCGGYYIDATTIVECLHSFCRSCIVKHLESSKYCPICEVQVHKTKPLINIRPDKTLQDIVYKLVPGLFENEMRNRRRFYRERPHYIKPNDSESSGEVTGERKIYVNDENITFSLVYHEGPCPTSVEDSYREFPPPDNNERRYFKCPTGVTVQHLKKLVRAKYELNDNNYKLEVYFRDQELHEDFTLLDVAYVYLWKTKGSLDLTYKIFENVVKRQKIETKPEKGLMEVTKPVETKVEPVGTEKKKEEEEEEDREKAGKEKQDGEMEEEKKKKMVVSKEEKQPEPAKGTPEPVKENGVTPGSEAKEVQLQISESGVMSVSQVEDSQIVKTVEETGTTKVTNSQTGGSGKEGKPGNGEAKPPPTKKASGKPARPYKTIRCSPKAWHPVIPKEKLRPTLMKNSDEPRKPLKFFRMRNMPRFLGNPSSGVKPMFGEGGDHPRPGEEKKAEGGGKTSNKILKIDPKTLRPIEKEEGKVSAAPSAPNLLTNPFIPNNNHFLFSDLHLLPPNSGNYKEKPPTAGGGGGGGGGGGFKALVPNGTYPPICFPTPEHSPPGFYPFGNLTKPQTTFPFPPAPDKMDPLLRASRLSPFGNLVGSNMAGFHASLPPGISRLINPHHHFRKINQALQRKNKEESTKETTKRCDDSLKVSKGEGEVSVTVGASGSTTTTTVTTTTTTTTTTTRTTTTTTTSGEGKKEEATIREGGEEKEKKKQKREDKEGGVRQREVNGETSESASEKKSDISASVEDKDKDKDKDKEKEKEKEKDKDKDR